MALGIWNKFSLWLEHILGGTALILGLKEVTEAADEAVATPVLIKPVIGLEVSPVIEGTYVGHSKLGQVLFTAEDVEDNGEVVLDDVDSVVGGVEGGDGGVVVVGVVVGGVLGLVQHSVLTASE